MNKPSKDLKMLEEFIWKQYMNETHDTDVGKGLSRLFQMKHLYSTDKMGST